MRSGVGKSAIVKEIAEELASDRTLTDSVSPKDDEFGFISFRLGLVESIDLGGLPYIEEGTQKKAFLGNLPRSGKGLFFLDEFAQAHSSVQATIGQLLDPKGKNEERRIGDYVFPSGWKIVLAGNRHTDRSGANKILRHCQDRTTAIQFTHDVEDWLAWADNNDIDLNVQGLIRFKTVKEIMSDKKYRLYEVNYQNFTNDLLEKKEDLKFSDLELIFKDMKSLFEKRGYIINWKALEKQSLNETINALAMASPFTLEEKQVLLEAESLNIRKSKISEILTTYNFDEYNNTTVQ